MAKIMLVDDDQMETELLRLRLTDAGHEVFVSEDGFVAPTRILNIQPDIVFLDFNLPVANGAQVLAKLRADPKTKAIPVVMATSMPRDHVFAALGDNTDVGFLAKPLDFSEMLCLVAALPARGAAGAS